MSTGPKRATIRISKSVRVSPVGPGCPSEKKRQATPAKWLAKGLSDAAEDLLVPKEKKVADPAAVLAPIAETPLRIRVTIDALDPGRTTPLAIALNDFWLALKGRPGFLRVLGQEGPVAPGAVVPVRYHPSVDSPRV